MLGNKAYESGVLDPTVHDLLVKDLERFVARANIPIEMVWTPMKTYCTDEEIEYVKHLHQQSANSRFGLVYKQPSQLPIQTRMACATGACLRNFVDACVMTAHEVVSASKDGGSITATVLMIPNFYMVKGGDLPDWQVSLLADVIYTRYAQAKQTFVGVGNLQKMETAYGSSLAQHLKTHFTII